MAKTQESKDVAAMQQEIVSAKSVPIVTDIVIKAKFNLELTRLKHQKIVQDAENIIMHKDTLNVDVPKLKLLRSLVSSIESARKVIKQPYKEAGDLVDKIAKDIISPLSEILMKKEAEYNKIAKEIEQERIKLEQENNRIQGIQSAISNLILNQSQAIAMADTVKELETIEDLLKFHKKDKVTYMEFLPELAVKVDELSPLIKKQKKNIDDLKELNKKKLAAERKGDDATLIKLMSKEDVVSSKIEEAKIVVQETAINQSTKASSAPVYIPTQEVKARRTTWKYELVDVDEALKTNRDVLDITLNSVKAKEILEEQKEVCTIGGKKEFVYGGIRFYEHKDY